MGIKIKKLYLQNFKVYKEQTFDLENSELVVFDGPNGFGKTSIYDAIELLFTGRIRRYDSIYHLIDQREIRNENPLYHHDGDGNPIIIKALFEFEGNDHILARCNPSINDPVLNFDHYILHQLSSFDEEISENNVATDDVLLRYLGANYKSDFEFINYIEQEDTLTFLKKKEKDKKEGIEYLFNTADFSDKVRKFKLINNRLKDFLNAEEGIKAKIRAVDESIREIRNSLKSGEETPYERILVNKEIDWDKEEVNFENYTYEELLDTNGGTLPRLVKLISNRADFLISFRNEQIDNLLTDAVLKEFFKYETFHVSTAQINVEKNIVQKFRNFENALLDFRIELTSDGKYDFPSEVKEAYKENSDIVNYEEKLNKLKTELTNSNLTGQVYARLLNTRDTLKSHLTEYHKHIDENGHCPLCGKDWESSKKLLDAIDAQKLELEKLNENLANSLNFVVDDFRKFALEILIPNFKEEFSRFTYKADYFQADFFDATSQDKRAKIRHTLAKAGIDMSPYLLKEVIFDHDHHYSTFRDELSRHKQMLNSDNVEPFFSEFFSYYFDSSEEAIMNLTVEGILKKIKYLNWIFSLHQSEMLKKKNEELEKLNIQKEAIEVPQQKIAQIIVSLEASLKQHNDSIIKDIELLFHIYSGRIVQDFQGGLGLFIVNKNDKIKFVTSPNRTFDAVFSMSTGQLSALVLSFTLALNKKYSKSNLLFIDDPIQSMDDINTAGFVEVLRNDFSDRQIFFSTHEQSMSTYVRYKFKKFGRDSIRIDLSELN